MYDRLLTKRRELRKTPYRFWIGLELSVYAFAEATFGASRPLSFYLAVGLAFGSIEHIAVIILRYRELHAGI